MRAGTTAAAIADFVPGQLITDPEHILCHCDTCWKLGDWEAGKRAVLNGTDHSQGKTYPIELSTPAHL